MHAIASAGSVRFIFETAEMGVEIFMAQSPVGAAQGRVNGERDAISCRQRCAGFAVILRRGNNPKCF
jgi:hypothetical protein